MNWPIYIKNFKNYLQLERGMSDNSVEAYVRDIEKLHNYVSRFEKVVEPEKMTEHTLRDFLHYLNDLELVPNSQARILSGIKAFYQFLALENLVNIDPTENLDAPKTNRKLPDTLSFPEIELLLDHIDVSTPEGTRNRAIIEVLYSCGLRVSELVNLQQTNCYFGYFFYMMKILLCMFPN